MAANQTVCTWFEQRSIIKFLVTENCKPCEICRRMCDVYGDKKNKKIPWSGDTFTLQ